VLREVSEIERGWREREKINWSALKMEAADSPELPVIFY
jgi:hypothetical protein